MTPKTKVKRDSVIIGLGLLLYAVISNSLSYGIAYIYNKINYGQWRTGIVDELPGILLSIAVYTASLTAAVIMADEQHTEWNFNKPKRLFGTAMLILGASYLPISILNGVASTLLKNIGVTSLIADVALPSNPAGVILTFIQAVALPAFLEELLFRGVIQRRLVKYGGGFAVIVTSVLFALMHERFALLPGMFLFSVAMGCADLMTDSLLPSFLMHFFNNFMALAQLALADRGIYRMIPSMTIMALSIFCVPFAMVSVIRNTKAGKIDRSLFISSAPRRWFYFTVPTIVFILYLLVMTVRYTSFSWWS